MAAVFPFVPNVQGPFTFQPVLDGQLYRATVRWNLFGQRYYVALNELQGPLVFNLPLIGSPNGVTIESIEWSNGTVTVTAARPMGFAIKSTIQLTLSGFIPTSLNGTWSCFIINEDTFTFQLTGDPGTATQIGQAIYNINLAAGYFDTSVLVFRESSQTFEVTP